MVITIFSDRVEIGASNDIVYCMSFDVLADVEKAIEIIRNLQESAHIDSAIITVT